MYDWQIVFVHVLKHFQKETVGIIYLVKNNNSLNISKIVNIIKHDKKLYNTYLNICEKYYSWNSCRKAMHIIVRTVLLYSAKNDIEPMKTIVKCALTKGYLEKEDIEKALLSCAPPLRVEKTLSKYSANS